MAGDSVKYVYIGDDSEIESQLRAAANGEDVVCIGVSNESIAGTQAMLNAFLSYRISHRIDGYLIRAELLRGDFPSPLQVILRARTMRLVKGRCEFPKPELQQLLAEFAEVERSGIKRYRALHFYFVDAFKSLSLSDNEFMSLRKAYPIRRWRILAINGLRLSYHLRDFYLTLPGALGLRVYRRDRKFIETHPQGVRSRWKMAAYRAIIRPILEAGLKFKKRKRVAFLLADMGVWKTETLYQAMLSDSRFEPLLAVVAAPDCNVNEVIEYLKFKDYDFTVIPAEKTICEMLHPDIIFYQKPYYGVVHERHEFYNNTRALFCYAGYGMRSCTNNWITHSPLLSNCWQIYYENECNRRLYSRLNPSCRNNGRATGLPVMDEMNLDAALLPDPWKPSDGKKRIIYAPHFSIDPNGWTHSSTFLTIGPLMLELAEKYADRVQWAFKPHPLLRSRLNEVWGKERTDEYYRRWAEAEWSQFENGRYAGLFAHSDALIHDCFSFTLEYLASGHPAMYLKNPDLPNGENLNEMHHKAMALHTQGNTREAIESFINKIISNQSDIEAERRDFIAEYLTPPAPGAVASILNALA